MSTTVPWRANVARSAPLACGSQAVTVVSVSTHRGYWLMANAPPSQ